MHQTNCYVVIFEWFLGQAGFHADMIVSMRSLSNDYLHAALLSACSGVRYQTVFIDIHYSDTFGLKI